MANNRTESVRAPSKIEMSSEWAPEERAELVTVLNEEIKALNAKEEQLRKTILYEAPCFGEIASKKAELKELRTYVEKMPSQFLQANRRNYSDYITK
jgi:hypothetical protein